MNECVLNVTLKSVLNKCNWICAIESFYQSKLNVAGSLLFYEWGREERKNKNKKIKYSGQVIWICTWKASADVWSRTRWNRLNLVAALSTQIRSWIEILRS